MMNLRERFVPVWRSSWVVLVYLLAGGLWITFSDALVEAWFTDPAQLSRVQTYKGVAFVVVTAGALFLVLLRQFRQDRERLNLQHYQQKKIQQLNRFRESIIDNASVWINVLDSRGRVVVWNKAAENISGYRRDEVVGDGRIWEWLYPDASYRKQIVRQAESILKGGEEVSGYETTIITRHGQRRLIAWNSRSFPEEEGLGGAIAIGQDVTETRAAEAALRRREWQLANLMDNLPGMAYRCNYDEHWTMRFVSSGCEELTGYQPEEIIENRKVSYRDLLEEEEHESLVRAVEVALSNAEPFSVEYRLNHRNGNTVWVWERGRAVEENGELVLEGIVLDIADRKALEQELSELATRDPLTGLFNRRELSRLLAEELERANRYNRELALLWIDFDHFKTINDRFGHAAGDAVLQSTSALIANNIRSVDAIGRFGGEEFVVLLPEMDQREARETAERLRRLVQETPQTLGDERTANLTISVGIAVFPANGRDADSLCAEADRAMYQAKQAGRNQVVMATPSGGL